MKKKIVYFSLVAVVSVVAVLSYRLGDATRNNSVVRLTYKGVTGDCSSGVKGKCTRPDPTGTVIELNLPSGVRADYRSTSYELSVPLYIYADEVSVSPVPAGKSLSEVEQSNYLLGVSRTLFVQAMPPETDFEMVVKQAVMNTSAGNSSAYKRYQGKIQGYEVIDDERCAKYDRSELKPWKASKNHDCMAKEVIYIPSAYPWAYLNCQRQFTEREGSIVRPFAGCGVV